MSYKSEGWQESHNLTGEMDGLAPNCNAGDQKARREKAEGGLDALRGGKQPN